MAPYKNVIFATDFSENANAAFEEAKGLAGDGAAKLTLLHVLPELTSANAHLVADQKDETHLRRVYPVEGAEYVTLHGHDAKTIVDYAGKQDGAVIVIGARGAGALVGFLGGGSVAEKIVKNSTVPVLVVPGK